MAACSNVNLRNMVTHVGRDGTRRGEETKNQEDKMTRLFLSYDLTHPSPERQNLGEELSQVCI